MDASSAVGGSSGAGAGSLTGALNKANNLNQQEFLKLLMTELTNQDPTNPQDDKQFLAEMAQFSTVQGVNSMSSSMGQLQASSLIGRTVQANVTSNGVTAPISGVVSAVKFDNGSTYLTVGGVDVELANVLQVHQ